MINLNDMTRKFLLGEQKETPSILAYVQALSEIINKIRATTQKEARNFEIAKQCIKEIIKGTKKLMEENKVLQEQISILEEEKNK